MYVQKKLLTALLSVVSFTACATLPAPGQPGAPNDPRYCGEPARNKDGSIKRSATQLKKFVAVFPCPSTLLSTTSCEGWAVDHTIPIADGGCDTPANMTWLPDVLKSCAGTICKDRWERKYNAVPRQAVIIKPPPVPSPAPAPAPKSVWLHLL